MNHLASETSPYLLQHAHNPVHWYAWRPEAFEQARRDDKPILVSIGYSTCHWCHVMERESFEDQAVADLMNAHFVCIKVDREERPDVDAIYMEACQILTGSGGWPLNCFLTPAGKPFYAGTYFPPRPAHNRPAWPQLLQHLANIWATQREVALDQADKLLAHIQRNDKPPASSVSPDDALEMGIFARLREQADPSEGGFGGAPKFPSTMALQWLLAFYQYSGQPQAREHALLSLQKMSRGGIYDHLGGGFARYATDRAWMVPHFEKMLYDNALLVGVFADAYKMSRQHPDAQHPATEWAQVIRETLTYVARDMTHPGGGFYSALDADSEGVEGKYYVWQKAEIEALLGEKSELFCDYYGVVEHGNWEETNILHRPHRDEAFCALHQISPDQLSAQLRESRQQLIQTRYQRIPPGLDDKIMLDWNALMVTAYAQAFAALGDESYRATARRALDFLWKNFQPQDALPTEWYHTWKGGITQYAAFLDDYAFLIEALIETWHISFEAQYLEKATALAEHVVAQFGDSNDGLFYFTDQRQTDIVVRKKDLYDNATPSGNATMLHNLHRLGLLLDRPEWLDRARQMLQTMRASIGQFPLSFARWARADLFEWHSTAEIAIVGPEALRLAQSLQSQALPNFVMAATEQPSDALSLLAGKTPGPNGETMIYLCQNYTCHAPVGNEAAFWELYRSTRD